MSWRHVTITQPGPPTVARVQFSIRDDDAEPTRAELFELLKKSTGSLILELPETRMLDGVSLGSLVMLYKHVRLRRRLLAVCGGPLVRDLLAMLHLDRLFPCAGSVAEAIALLERQP